MGGSDSEAETEGWGKGDPGTKPGIESYRASAPPHSVWGTWAGVSSLTLRALICKDDWRQEELTYPQVARSLTGANRAPAADLE